MNLAKSLDGVLLLVACNYRVHCTFTVTLVNIFQCVKDSLPVLVNKITLLVNLNGQSIDGLLY